MAKFTWSETFFSIEGEGRHAGHPTVYSRFTMCNFECRGFNNPEKLDTTKVEVLGFDPKDYKTLNELPMIVRGCDSIYSWDRKFSHLWKTATELEHAQELVDLLPGKQWKGRTGQPVMWSITGGEPTLHWKKLGELFNHELIADCQHILIETNCSVEFKDGLIEDIGTWLRANPKRVWTWSNSPKLSVSGEKWEEAIRGDIAVRQIKALREEFGEQRVGQYFKFVCDDTDASFDEVEKAMNEYYAAGIDRETEVYIMPTACTKEQMDFIAQRVAEQCMQRGYIYCHRVHNSVFGNSVGT